MSVFLWGLDKWQGHLQIFVHFLELLSNYLKFWLKPKNALIRSPNRFLNENVP
jgi:hypothetical protein